MDISQILQALHHPTLADALGIFSALSVIIGAVTGRKAYDVHVYHHNETPELEQGLQFTTVVLFIVSVACMTALVFILDPSLNTFLFISSTPIPTPAPTEQAKATIQTFYTHGSLKF